MSQRHEKAAHFAQRWEERGDPSISGAEMLALVEDGIKHQTVDLALRHEGTLFWRFLVKGVPYYAVEKQGQICTVLTHQMFTQSRTIRKGAGLASTKKRKKAGIALATQRLGKMAEKRKRRYG